MRRNDAESRLGQIMSRESQLRRNPETLLQPYRELIAVYDEILLESPDLDYARSTRARMLHQLGRVEEAEALYREILKEASQSEEAMLGLAEILIDRRDWEEAKGHLDASRRLGTGSADLRWLRGRYYYDRGEYEQALDATSQVLSPTRWWDLAVLRARSFLALGRAEAALQALATTVSWLRTMKEADLEALGGESAKRREDRAFQVWIVHAEALLAVGRRADARDSLDQARGLRPDDPAVRAIAEKLR